jgi:hypothetical protein
MTRIVDATVWLTFLGQVLLVDQESLDPLAPRWPVAVIGLALACLASIAARGHRSSPGSLDRWLLGGIALLTLACCLSPAPLAATGRWALGLLTFQAYLLGKPWGHRPTWIVTLARVSIVMVVAGHVWITDPWMRPAGRLFETHVQTRALVSTFANPDYLAGWLIVATPLAAGGLRGWPFGMLGLAALGWTLSRGAGLGLLTAWLLVGTGQVRSNATAQVTGGPPLKYPTGSLWLIASVITVAVGLTLAGPEGRSKLLDPSTFVKRLQLWGAGARLIPQAPILGHGVGRFEELYGAHRPAEWETLGMVASTEWAHDLPLHVAVETGLAGVAMLLGIVGAIIRTILATRVDPLARAAAIGVAAFLIHNLVSVTAFILPVALLAALTLGVLEGRRELLEGRGFRPAPSRPTGMILAAFATLALFDLVLAPWSLDRNRALHLAGKARTELLAGRFDAGRRIASEALACEPGNPRIRDLTAGALAETGEPIGALAHYLVVESIDPGLGSSSYNRGRVLLDANRPRVALVQLERHVVRDPRSLSCRYALAEAYFLTGRIDRSREQLDRARELAGSNRALLGRLEALAASLGPPTSPSPSR